MKKNFINKLAPTNKGFVLSQVPISLNTATNTDRAMWKCKNPAGYVMMCIQNLIMSPIRSETEDSLQNLPDDIREKYIMTIKNKRNNQYYNNY
jgi:hypothetical protein